MCKLQYLATCSYIHVYFHWAKHINFKQNIQKNRLKIKELPERKIGEKKQNRLIPINDFSPNYRERLIKLKLLPLMMTLELSDIVFFIKLIDNPTLKFNISTFTSSKTRSSNFKLQHIRSSHNLTRNFYFNRFPCLWNALPPINIINCPINMIKYTIKSY